MYKFFCFKIEIKTKADSYMPFKAMAHSPELILIQNGTLFMSSSQSDFILFFIVVF